MIYKFSQKEKDAAFEVFVGARIFWHYKDALVWTHAVLNKRTPSRTWNSKKKVSFWMDRFLDDIKILKYLVGPVANGNSIKGMDIWGPLLETLLTFDGGYAGEGF